MRRLGVDPGSVRTGLAFCESGVSVAVPHGTLRHRTLAEAAQQVAAVARERDVQEIVVGLPLRLDGSEGEAARRCRRFVSALGEHLEVPVILWDERLSTAAAERVLNTTGVHGKARREVVDQAAATLLLQNYLDSRQEQPWDPPISLSMPDPLPLNNDGPGGRGQRGNRGNRRRRPKGGRGSG